MKKINMLAGHPSAQAPTLHWWIEVTEKGTILVRAQFAFSGCSQNVAVISTDADGKFGISSRIIRNETIAKALGIEGFGSLPISSEPEPAR